MALLYSFNSRWLSPIENCAAGASLLGGGAYPTIRDSFYIDLNVKYVK